mmetsp:Transcript_59641/g.171035  ORF Transcript_59641/g.171035 Transcript_59641/m.171035 type:complete len:232 (-) Transcript_59641:146-841(-)
MAVKALSAEGVSKGQFPVDFLQILQHRGCFPLVSGLVASADAFGSQVVASRDTSPLGDAAQAEGGSGGGEGSALWEGRRRRRLPPVLPSSEVPVPELPVPAEPLPAARARVGRLRASGPNTFSSFPRAAAGCSASTTSRSAVASPSSATKAGACASSAAPAAAPPPPATEAAPTAAALMPRLERAVRPRAPGRGLALGATVARADGGALCRPAQGAGLKMHKGLRLAPTDG